MPNGLDRIRCSCMEADLPFAPRLATVSTMRRHCAGPRSVSPWDPEPMVSRSCLRSRPRQSANLRSQSPSSPLIWSSPTTTLPASSRLSRRAVRSTRTRSSLSVTSFRPTSARSSGPPTLLDALTHRAGLTILRPLQYLPHRPARYAGSAPLGAASLGQSRHRRFARDRARVQPARPLDHAPPASLIPRAAHQRMAVYPIPHHRYLRGRRHRLWL